MNDRKKYILRRRNEYLIGWTQYLTGSGEWHTVFGQYKYDAYRMRELGAAKRMVHNLIDPGEEWEILLFDPLTGDEKSVWKCKKERRGTA